MKVSGPIYCIGKSLSCYYLFPFTQRLTSPLLPQTLCHRHRLRFCPLRCIHVQPLQQVPRWVVWLMQRLWWTQLLYPALIIIRVQQVACTRHPHCVLQPHHRPVLSLFLPAYCRLPLLLDPRILCLQQIPRLSVLTQVIVQSLNPAALLPLLLPILHRKLQILIRLHLRNKLQLLLQPRPLVNVVRVRNVLWLVNYWFDVLERMNDLLKWFCLTQLAQLFCLSQLLIALLHVTLCFITFGYVTCARLWSYCCLQLFLLVLERQQLLVFWFFVAPARVYPSLPVGKYLLLCDLSLLPALHFVVVLVWFVRRVCLELFAIEILWWHEPLDFWFLSWFVRVRF